MKSTRRATIVAVAVASLLAVCAGSVSGAAAKSGSTEATKAVTISVASLIPGSTPAAIQQFNNQVKSFEKANPTIDVKPVEYQWTGPTFAARSPRAVGLSRNGGATAVSCFTWRRIGP